jgi:hypothetical protein
MHYISACMVLLGSAAGPGVHAKGAALSGPASAAPLVLDAAYKTRCQAHLRRKGFVCHRVCLPEEAEGGVEGGVRVHAEQHAACQFSWVACLIRRKANHCRKRNFHDDFVGCQVLGCNHASQACWTLPPNREAVLKKQRGTTSWKSNAPQVHFGKGGTTASEWRQVARRFWR